MREHVSLQRALDGRAIRAHGARERLFAGVAPRVALQVNVLLEHLAADGTGQREQACGEFRPTFRSSTRASSKRWSGMFFDLASSVSILKSKFSVVRRNLRV